MKRFAIFASFIMLAALLSACGAATPTAAETPMPVVAADSAIIAEGKLEPVGYVELSFSAGGTVEDVLTAEGENVSTGDVLARLDNTDLLQADIDQAEDALARADEDLLAEISAAYEELRIAQQRLDNYDIPTKFNGMTPTEAAAAMLVKVNEARDDYEPYMDYANPRGYIKELKDALDDAWADYNQSLDWLNRETDLDAAKIRLVQAQADYEKLQNGENIPAKVNLLSAESALENAELRSPIAGTVTTLDVKVGESVGSGMPVATVADFSTWLVKTTDLTELDVVKIHEGQQVIVTLDALPDVQLNGTVQSISQGYTESQGDVVYEVTIALDETDPSMRWGMTALVEFVE